jgi:allantoinase
VILYSPIVDRPRITWPGDARVALWVAPNIEFYDFLPPPNPHRVAWDRVPEPPDVMAYSYRDYGNRVGIWRLAPVLDHYGVRATASLNIAVLDKYPEICEAMVERDWELMCHGIFNTRFFLGMGEDEERAVIQDAIETMKRRTGKTMKGLFGPCCSATENTMRLAAEAGLIYSCEWYCDDQPFPIDVPTGKLVGVPYGWDVNDDGFTFLDRVYDAEHFLQMVKDQFDVLYEEGAESGRVMCIALHPFLTGQAHAIRYLDRMLDYILSHSGVWATTADKIAEHYLAAGYDDEMAYLRGQRR